jgi:SARP family transcriptional regulator, regulator of embCAB operon
VIEFNILGPLEISTENKDGVLVAPKARQLLALLIVHANQVVSIEDIMEELWGNDPPSSAVTTAQTYICHLRKQFSRFAAIDHPPRLATTVGPGYVLHMNSARSDVESFRRLHALGRTLLAEGHPGRAAPHLTQALQLWRGLPLANIRLGRLLQGHVTALKEERTHALELRIEADMQLGRHRELVGELRSLVLSHPLNEWLHARLIETLARCGRRREALDVYSNLYATLYRDLGMVPSWEVQHLQRTILEEGLVKPGAAMMNARSNA